MFVHVETMRAYIFLLLNSFLHLGLHKTLSLQYTYNNTTFSDATTVCDLGVGVDSSLKYDGHINRIVAMHIHASLYCSAAFSIVIWFFYAKHTLFTLDLYSNTRPAFGLHISPNT